MSSTNQHKPAQQQQTEEASPHKSANKSAKTHANTGFCDS